MAPTKMATKLYVDQESTARVAGDAAAVVLADDYTDTETSRVLDEHKGLISAAQMRDSLQIADPGGSIIIDYLDGSTRHIFSPLDGIYSRRWKMTKALSGAWGLSGKSAVRLFAAWDDVEAGITYGGGTWAAPSATPTALGGGYRSTSTANRFAEFQITGFTELWIAHAKRTNGGITWVTIDGATTLVNELPLVATHRELSMYAVADDHNGWTKVASGLNPLTTYTVRLTNSGTAGPGGGTFIHFSGYGYPSANTADPRVNGVGVINNAILEKQYSDVAHIMEYAIEIAPDGSINWLFSGMKHENELLIFTEFRDQNGGVVTVDLTTRRAAVSKLTLVQQMKTTHVDSGALQYATVDVEHRFTSRELEVWHRHTFLRDTQVRFAYMAMLAADSSVTRGQVAGDYGNVYDLTLNNDSVHGNTFSRAAAMWDPAYPYVVWLYSPDFEGVKKFRETASLKLWIQDRSPSGGVNRDKIYFTRSDAPMTVLSGAIWENTARYGLSRVTDIVTRFPLRAP